MKSKILKLISVLMIILISCNVNVYAEELPVISDTALVDSFSTDIKNNAYVLYDMDSNSVITQNNSEERLAPASITKIMTLILIYEAIDDESISSNDMVTVSEHAASMGGSQVYLEPFEELTVEEMIKCIVISSANDACVAMAEYVGGTEDNFVNMMNMKADELKMNNTNFVNACGLDAEGHYSSAMDIAIMSDYLLENFPQIMKYTLTWMDSITHNTAKGSKEFGLTNTNKLIKTYDGITGLKTGSTGNSGYSVSASAERNGTGLVAVVLGADTTQNRFRLASELLNFGFANYKSFIPNEEHLEYIAEFKSSVKERYNLRVNNPQGVLVNKSFDESKLSYSYKITDTTYPINSGDKCGLMTVEYEGQIISEYDLIACEDICSVTYFDYLLRLINKF